MALWLVRAGEHGDQQEWALANKKAVVGWASLPDLSQYKTRDEMLEGLRLTYPEEKPAAIRNFCGQLWAFSKRIAKGDLIALPLKKGRNVIAIGKVSGEYKYYPENPAGTKHTIPVDWIVEDMPRTKFDQDLLYSLGAFMTVCQIQRNNAEQRVKDLLAGRPPRVVNAPDEATDESLQAPVDLAQHAADQISQWIARKFTGHRLAVLVNAVLQAQGYKTEVSPPGPDGGVDIIAGKGPLGFDPPKVLVQVKGGDIQQDVKVLRELKGVMSDFKASQGLLVAWGGFKKTVYEEARKNFFEIRLWNASGIVENVLEYYEKFPEEIKADLPIKRVWVLVQEEGE